MEETPEVSVSVAGFYNMDTVKNLFLAYFYDMARFDPNIIINPYGLPLWEPFGKYAAKTPAECIAVNWWIRDLCTHYILHAGGKVAGFACVLDDPKHIPEGTAYELLDFYVTPKFRGQGVGRQAAKQIFELHRGVWVLFELEKNLPAIAFWHKVLDEYTGKNYEDRDNGTQQRFRSVATIGQ